MKLTRSSMAKKTLIELIPENEKGFGLTESLIALTVGTLVIGMGAVSLRSTQSLIKTSGERSNQQQNIVNGLRLMRSEIERSLYLIVNGEHPEEEMAYTNLGSYQNAISNCQSKAESFIPLFGLKMTDVTEEPVIYGISGDSNATPYSIKRCGRPLGLDGRYDNSKPIFVAKVIDNISSVPCLEDSQKECKNKPMLKYLNSPENSYYFGVVNNKTPSRQYQEPAFRFETDTSRKLFRIIAPIDCKDSTNNSACSINSSVSVSSSSKESGKQTLELTAYTRADKRLVMSDKSSNSLEGNWFRDVNSKRIRFLVDGSGSMSACMSWSYGYGEELETGDTYQTFHTPQGDPLYRGNLFETTNAICHETRMERLQRELKVLINQLPQDAKISLEVFSTANRANNRQWNLSTSGLVTIGDPGNRDSAISFVESLDDDPPGDWGGTNPWDGLQRSFDDTEADTLYFLSDGLPTKTLATQRGNAEYSNNYLPAALYFASLNDSRNRPLVVNTTSVMLSSEWMQELSDQTSGNYLQSQ